MGKRAVAGVAVEMWKPAFGAGFRAPRTNQASQVSCSSRPPSARHFHSKAANSAHFVRNRVFGLHEGLKWSSSRKPPKMHPPARFLCGAEKSGGPFFTSQSFCESSGARTMETSFNTCGLRKKIENDPARPKYILTEPWVGYGFHNPSEEEL